MKLTYRDSKAQGKQKTKLKRKFAFSGQLTVSVQAQGREARGSEREKDYTTADAR